MRETHTYTQTDKKTHREAETERGSIRQKQMIVTKTEGKERDAHNIYFLYTD